MRVLIVTPHVFAGGAEKVTLHLAYHLTSMGWEVGIATLSLDLSRLPPKFKDLNYLEPEEPLNPLKVNGLKTTLESTIRESYALAKLLKEHADGFDILNPSNFPSYWATFFARTGKPVIWTSSETFGPYRQTRDVYDRSRFFRLALGFGIYIDRFVVRHGVDKIVTCSELNSRLIKQRYGRPSRVIPTCVDYDFFSKNCPDAKGRLGLEGSFVLLQVGALVQSKNHILSIRALHILKRKVPNAKLIIVGVGPWEQILKNEVAHLGLQEDVFLRGVVTEEELRLLYHTCDVNLFPVKNQTYGLVPFEALAAGKPTIVSEECGAAEIIMRERTGIVINPNVKSLADAIIFALRHPEFTRDAVRRGQMYVRENLAWEGYAREMYKAFEDVLDSA